MKPMSPTYIIAVLCTLLFGGTYARSHTCTEDQMKVVVKIKTDDYPDDVSWTLTNDCEGSKVYNPNVYVSEDAEYSHTYCLPSRSAITFTIEDSYGDGLCCSEGDGGYEILVDGAVVISGGEFEDEETAKYGSCDALSVDAGADVNTDADADDSDDDGPPFTFLGNIGEEFFDDDDGLEASGVDIAPDRSHLVIVTDEGEMIFLNLLDYESGHCIFDLSDELDETDLEGVAFDPTIWEPDDMHVYVVHEGADDDEPLLYKIKYEYDPDEGECSASLVDTTSLHGAIPCLETSNGIESIALKSASTDAEPAVFLVGIQDTGKIYEVTSEGRSNGPYCYDSGMGEDDVSATTYNSERGHMWSYIESEDTIAVVDASKDCPVATYEMPSSTHETDEEGLVIDFENGLMYLVVDGQGDGSIVSVYEFTYPENLGECLDLGVSPGSCSDFEVCTDDRRKSLR